MRHLHRRAGFERRIAIKLWLKVKYVALPYLEYYGGGVHFERSKTPKLDRNWIKYSYFQRKIRIKRIFMMKKMLNGGRKNVDA
jgi:hypothetical protein